VKPKKDTAAGTLMLCRPDSDTLDILYVDVDGDIVQDTLSRAGVQPEQAEDVNDWWRKARPGDTLRVYHPDDGPVLFVCLSTSSPTVTTLKTEMVTTTVPVARKTETKRKEGEWL